eukprot:7302864-Prymnesium_polylepis.1
MRATSRMRCRPASCGGVLTDGSHISLTLTEAPGQESRLDSVIRQVWCSRGRERIRDAAAAAT